MKGFIHNLGLLGNNNGVQKIKYAYAYCYWFKKNVNKILPGKKLRKVSNIHSYLPSN